MYKKIYTSLLLKALEKYYILLKNVSQMSSEQLQKLKQIVFKKINFLLKLIFFDKFNYF